MSKWLQGEAIHHQVALAGRVTESGAGQPIRGALLSLTGRQEQAHTAVDGHFHFVDLPVGQYKLLVSARGHLEISQTVKLTNSKPKILDMSLSLQKKNS